VSNANGPEAGRGPAWIWPVASLAGMIALWQVALAVIPVPAWLLPSPASIVEATWAWYPQLPAHTLATLGATLAGYGLAIAVGVPVAVVIVTSRFLEQTVYPILLVFQSVPKVAVAPILLVWVGYGQLPKILIVFLVCFFPVVIGAATGLNSAPPEMLNLVRSLCATRGQVFVKVRFPSAMPHLFVGLKVAITLAVIGAVIGEFVGSNQGLGYIIVVSMSQVNTSLAFGAMALLAILSIALFYAVEWIERLVVPWSHPENPVV
jgi:NitT/TauT family transport system permease protein